MNMLSRILVRFDESPSWEAYTDGRTWNGFVVPWVSAETRDAIAAWIASMPEPGETPAEIRALPCVRTATVNGPRDLYQIDLGLTFWVRLIAGPTGDVCPECGAPVIRNGDHFECACGGKD